MAFTESQKAKIRLWLGYPDINRYRNTWLEGLFEVGVLSAEAEASIVTLLDQLDTIDASIVSGAASQNTGSLKRVDEIEFYGTTATSGQSALAFTVQRARMFAGRISTTLGIPFGADAWGSDGYPGDKYTGAGGLGVRTSGRGGPIPLG